MPNPELRETEGKSPEWSLVNGDGKHGVQGVLKAICLQRFNHFADVCVFYPRRVTTGSTYGEPPGAIQSCGFQHLSSSAGAQGELPKAGYCLSTKKLFPWLFSHGLAEGFGCL